MASLSYLTHLVLNDTAVTDGWQNLPLQLERLYISNAGLTAVPPELSRLVRLMELDLSSNSLVGGGFEALAGLSSLRKLDLDTCDLGAAGPAVLVALPPALQALNLWLNMLTEVPAALATLTGLTALDLTQNKLVGGWEHLAGLEQLKALYLLNCGLTAVPQELSQLTALTALCLGGNRIASGWHHLAGMQQLADLDVLICSSTTAVPEVFSNLTALTRLRMGGCPFVSGWQHLAGMQRLEVLHLESCDLNAVPEVLSQLAALTRLHIEGNPIANGWQHLSRLPLLSEMSTDDKAHALGPYAES